MITKFKVFESNEPLSDYIVKVGMFFDKIREDLELKYNQKLGIKLSSSRVEIFVKGTYFNGDTIIFYDDGKVYYSKNKSEVGVVSVMFTDEKYTELEYISEYMRLKIIENIDHIQIDKPYKNSSFRVVYNNSEIPKLHNVRFNTDEVQRYIQAEKFNL